MTIVGKLLRGVTSAIPIVGPAISTGLDAVTATYKKLTTPATTSPAASNAAFAGTKPGTIATATGAPATPAAIAPFSLSQAAAAKQQSQAAAGTTSIPMWLWAVGIVGLVFTTLIGFLLTRKRRR